MKKIMLFSALIFIILNAFAVSNYLPIERLNDIQELNKQVDVSAANGIKIEKIKNALEAFSSKRDLDCQFAFGHQKFCDCLNNRLPIAVDFYQYIGIITSNKIKLMSRFNVEGRNIVNMVFKARNTCASELK